MGLQSIKAYLASNEFALDFVTLFLGSMYLITANGNNQWITCDTMILTSGTLEKKRHPQVDNPALHSARSSQTWTLLMGAATAGALVMMIFQIINFPKRLLGLIYLCMAGAVSIFASFLAMTMNLTGEYYLPPCVPWANRLPYTFGMAVLFFLSFLKSFISSEPQLQPEVTPS